jgi:hypothetical protein
MTIQAAHAVHGHRQPARHGGGPTTALLVGGLCGLAWAAGLRGFLAQIAGTASGVDWAGTFAWILLSGRGPRWARTLSGAAALTAIPIWALTVTSFAGPGLALDTPRGAWVAVYYWSFLAVLMLACAIPTSSGHANRKLPVADGTHSRQAWGARGRQLSP